MYVILKASTPEELSQSVIAKLADGWICQGGVIQQIDSRSGYAWFYQAMVKVPEEPKKGNGKGKSG